MVLSESVASYFTLQHISTGMAIATTVGPLEESTRDALADYRDQNEFSSYNAALKGLLESAGTEAENAQ